jgi:hypothetical protein
MRGPLVAAAIACLGAWAGCGFKAPRGAPDAAPDDGPPGGNDGPPGDAPAPQLCLSDPAYMTSPGERRYKRLALDATYDAAIDRCAA